MEKGKRIAKTMLEWWPSPDLEHPPAGPDFSEWDALSSKAAALLESSATAFLFAGFLTQADSAWKAWERPYLLRQRLGHLSPKKIAAMTPSHLARFVGNYKGGEALHRFPKKTAKTLVLACRDLTNHYGGDASNIWMRDPDAATVVANFRRFHGIGQKIANMMARLLIDNYGVTLQSCDKVDIAVDRHVARVFLRTGLVKGTRECRVGAVQESVIEVARALHPAYPAALDQPAFSIGIRWCTAKDARCWDQDGEPCPLAQACTKRKRGWQVR